MRGPSRQRLRRAPAPPPPARRRPHLRRPASRPRRPPRRANSTTNSPASKNASSASSRSRRPNSKRSNPSRGPAGRAVAEPGTPSKPGLLLLNPCAVRPPRHPGAGRFRRRPAGRRPGQGRCSATAPRPGSSSKSRPSDSRGSAAPASPATRKPNPENRRPSSSPTSTASATKFFEAEIDPATGGLRSIRDSRRPRESPRPATRLPARQQDGRRGNQGHVRRAGPRRNRQHRDARGRSRRRAGHASGSGSASGSAGRCWKCGSSCLPERPPEGYPWHAYYGARFAWRDERATLLRGVLGQAVGHDAHPPEDAGLSWNCGPARIDAASCPAGCRSTSGTARGCST